MTINQIHNVYKLPDSLRNQWSAHSYHGSEEHNSRAVINRYLGYWDANPATLMPLSQEDSARLYVEMMGGADNIMEKGKELYGQGKYLLATEIMNKLVYAEPANQSAKDMLADVYDQIGYQKESQSVRNSFLAAAYELRNGMPSGASPKASGPDVIRGMVSFDDKIQAGKAILEGDRKPFDDLKSMLTTFTMDFELLPGTIPDAAKASSTANPFQQSEPADSSGG